MYTVDCYEGHKNKTTHIEPERYLYLVYRIDLIYQHHAYVKKNDRSLLYYRVSFILLLRTIWVICVPSRWRKLLNMLIFIYLLTNIWLIIRNWQSVVGPLNLSTKTRKEYHIIRDVRFLFRLLWPRIAVDMTLNTLFTGFRSGDNVRVSYATILDGDRTEYLRLKVSYYCSRYDSYV